MKTIGGINFLNSVAVGRILKANFFFHINRSGRQFSSFNGKFLVGTTGVVVFKISVFKVWSKIRSPTANRKFNCSDAGPRRYNLLDYNLKFQIQFTLLFTSISLVFSSLPFFSFLFGDLICWFRWKLSSSPGFQQTSKLLMEMTRNFQWNSLLDLGRPRWVKCRLMCFCFSPTFI